MSTTGAAGISTVISWSAVKARTGAAPSVTTTQAGPLPSSPEERRGLVQPRDRAGDVERAAAQPEIHVASRIDDQVEQG